MWQRSTNRPGRWGLRARLLVPILVLVPLAMLSLGVVEEFSARRQAETLVRQHGDTTVEGILRRLDERRRTQEIYAQMLALMPPMADAIQRADVVGLAQAFIPSKVHLGLGNIVVYASDESEILRLGAGTRHPDELPLVRAALGGQPQSLATTSDEGLVVLAAVPVRPGRLTGVVVVSEVLAGDALRSARGGDPVELAVYRDGVLLTTTLSDPEQISRLAAVSPAAGRTATLTEAADAIHYHATVRPLSDKALLVALVSTASLQAATRARTGTVLLSALLLITLLIASGVLLTRRVVRPVEALVGATAAMARGDYDRRVAPSGIRELDGLARSVNHLGEQLQAQVAELQRRALYDTLSSLPNRAFLMDRLEEVLAGDAEAAAVALFYLDLDNFKPVNDSLGHQAGDQLLVTTAQRLKDCVRPGDLVARLGGDEFAVLLEEEVDEGEAIAVARRILAAIAEPLVIEGQPVRVSASIGIALAEPGLSPAALLRDADAAMYAVKRRGKTGYQVFTPHLARAG